MEKMKEMMGRRLSLVWDGLKLKHEFVIQKPPMAKCVCVTLWAFDYIHELLLVLYDKME